jgi:hypothetical protein
MLTLMSKPVHRWEVIVGKCLNHPRRPGGGDTAGRCARPGHLVACRSCAPRPTAWTIASFVRSTRYARASKPAAEPHAAVASDRRLAVSVAISTYRSL